MGATRTWTTFAAITLALATSIATEAPAYAQKPDAKKPADKKTADPPKVEEKKEEPKPEEKAVDKTDDKAPAKTDAAHSVEPPADTWDIKDVEELPSKTYFFVGLRYRGNIVPKFMINLFVDEGATVYSNSVGAEFDLRKEGFSLIPAITFTELGTGDILFKEKNSKDIPGNYSLVNSSLKVLYFTADLLWSTKISKNVEFEYGAGFGLGIVFGSLVNNWVKEGPNGLVAEGNNKSYVICPTVEPAGGGCNKADHQNSDVDKVGRYVEKDWLQGGSQPVVFPWIAIPQIGMRFKPIKQFVGRLGLGFSLTGFWFGLSGQYGLEQRPKP
jgi:hypothetical protein